MKFRHHKHPDHLYTVVGTGIVSATVESPLADMEAVVVYSDTRGSIWVCRKAEFPAGYYALLATGKVQAREPLKIADAITVYRSDADNNWWVRRTDEFNDGRFTKVGD